MKQAQGIGINVVILTAIALLVLVVIAIIINQSGGQLRAGVERCEVQGGQCFAPGAQPPGATPMTESCGDNSNLRCYRVT